jgi:transcription antitermination factor NusG
MRQWSDRKKMVEFPLINGYVFVNISALEIDKTLQTKGIVNFVRESGKVAVIREEEMNRLKQLVDLGYQIESDVSSSELEPIFKEKERFKNGGGDIENFLTLCKINHGVRVFCLEEAKKKILTIEDLKETIKEFNVKKEEKDTKPPPMMYL